MREFFRGWRRKAGSVALVMACLLTGGWIKSIWLQDEVEFYCGARSLVTLYSVEQSVIWSTYNGRGVHSFLSFPRWRSGPQIGVFKKSDVIIDWQWNGFAVGSIHWEMTSDRIVYWKFPYWPIVSTLTLLSAYLILWKPRQAGAGQKCEPSASETTQQSLTDIR